MYNQSTVLIVSMIKKIYKNLEWFVRSACILLTKYIAALKAAKKN